VRLLCLDIGNTRIKAAVFQDGQYESGITLNKNDDVRILQITFEQWISNKNIKHVAYADVGFKENERLAFLTNFTECVVWEVSTKYKTPFRVLYKTPETLGIDRLCAVAGAYSEYSGSPLLVIDAGTAITYDYMNEHEEYLGGAISPGMELKFKSLNEYTFKLPLVNFNENFPFIGQSTEESIRTGVQSTSIAEMEGMIARFQVLSCKPLKVILTGGNADFFSKYITFPHEINSNLVLKGIDFLVRYNLQ
jgi:type III pantothenate kinase